MVSFEDQAKQAGLFVVVLLVLWAIAFLALGSSVVGFFAGLIAATFATGAAKLVQRRDGSWTLIKRR